MPFLCCGSEAVELPEKIVSDNEANALSYVGHAAYDVLRQQHGHHHHTCWNVTNGVIKSVHFTPRHGWDRDEEYPSDQVHDEHLPKTMEDVMSKAQIWCDITSLTPPDGLFLQHFQQGLVRIAKNAEGKEKPIVVRMMFGNIVGMPVNCTRVIKAFTDQLPVDANIHLWVGSWRDGVSWNHSKIIAADGKYLFTGGHNLYDTHYLRADPVHDISFEMEGRIAHDGHRFCNAQWEFIQKKQDTLFGNLADKIPDNYDLLSRARVVISEWPVGKATVFAPLYEDWMVPNYDALEGQVPLLALGRQGTILKHARPADDAFVAMFESAKSVIHMALQDLGPVCLPGTKVPLPGCIWPKNYLNVFARALWLKGVDIEIALSNPNSLPNGESAMGGVYGNGWSCVDVAAEIIKAIKKQFPEATDDDLREKVAKNLRVCFIREARGNVYTSGANMGMHAKHFIVDDRILYIGSQNLYVCDLAEWGVAVDDKETVEKMMDEYWRPMWKHSFKGVDCNVEDVLDGLNVDRDGEKVSKLHFNKQLREANRVATHAHRNGDFYDEEGSSSDDEKK